MGSENGDEKLEATGQEEKSWSAQPVDITRVRILAQRIQCNLNEMSSDLPFFEELKSDE